MKIFITILTFFLVFNLIVDYFQLFGLYHLDENQVVGYIVFYFCGIMSRILENIWKKYN